MNTKRILYISAVFFILFLLSVYLLAKKSNPIDDSYPYKGFVNQIFSNSKFQIDTETSLPLKRDLFPFFVRINKIVFGHSDNAVLATKNNDTIVRSNVGSRSQSRTEIKLIKGIEAKLFFNVKLQIIDNRVCFVIVVADEESLNAAHLWLKQVKMNYPNLPVTLNKNNIDASLYYKHQVQGSSL